MKAKGRLPVDSTLTAEALRKAGYDPRRVVEVGRYALVIVNYAGFPLEHWTRKTWLT